MSQRVFNLFSCLVLAAARDKLLLDIPFFLYLTVLFQFGLCRHKKVVAIVDWLCMFSEKKKSFRPTCSLLENDIESLLFRSCRD